MEQVQFTAIILMSLLTLKLLMLPKRTVSSWAAKRSRLMMVLGMVLLLVQFTLQFVFRFRAMGVTQAVMLNLIFFVPASWAFSLSVLYLQRRGNITPFDKYLGLAVWGIVLVLIIVASNIDGKPLLSASHEMRWAEIIGSVCYASMQCYYVWREIRNLHVMREAMMNYFDFDVGYVLRWMDIGVIIIAAMAALVPLLIFFTGIWLAIYALLIFVGIFYLVDSFCNFLLTAAFAKVQEAEQDEVTAAEGRLGAEGGEVTALSEEAALRVERAVERWKASGGHLKSGMKLPAAAEDMQLPRYLLSAWLKQWGKHYNDWLTDLRVDEAKRMLREHPDWNNEAIALHCGFADRSYFQKKFKERTGFSPAEYINS